MGIKKPLRKRLSASMSSIRVPLPHDRFSAASAAMLYLHDTDDLPWYIHR